MATKLTILCLLSSINLFAQNDANVNKNNIQSDDMFPPSVAAKPFINFDGKGVIINGKRTFLVSGGIHYPRVPQQNWHDILLKLKRAGFNTVETYIFWNFHESIEGKYDFTSERHDIGAFLDEAKKVGLYAIVRVGPYVCAEWENGGYPTWLMQKPGMLLRTKDYQPYLDEVAKWFNKMLPIIAKRQIQKGGNVILVQLENEHPAERWKYWGTNIYGKYFEKLLDVAHINGLEVPMFYSGMHHASDAIKEPIYPQQRTSPWMCMELWTTWFDNYGTTPELLIKGERSPWRIVAEGGAGFNLYMAHGGSTFGYYNFNGDTKYGDRAEKGTTCYDYGTLIGQTGDTRELYLRLKRLGYFTETFGSILGNSINSTTDYKDWVKGPDVYARSSDSGTLIFVDNPRVDTFFHLPSGNGIHMAAKEIVGFVKNFSIAPGLSVQSAETRILGIIPQGNNLTSIVCYGHPGDTGNIIFSKPFSAKDLLPVKEGFSGNGKQLSFVFNAQTIGEQLLHFGATTIRVLTMDKDGANFTWFANAEGQQKIITGVPYLDAFGINKYGQTEATIDYSFDDKIPAQIVVYGTGKTLLLPGNIPAATGKINLQEWVKFADPLMQDVAWKLATDTALPQIGADNGLSPYAWYRTVVNHQTSVDSISFAYIGDRANFYLDGKLAVQYDFRKNKTGSIPIQIPAGKHQLAVFVAYSGRNKMAGYMGPTHIYKLEKGLIGPVLFNGKDTAVLNWAMKGEDRTPGHTVPLKNSDIVPAYYQTHFAIGKAPQQGEAYRLETTGLSAGSVWLNGYNVGKYPELIKSCPGLWLPSAWIKPGQNELLIYDEQGNLVPGSGVKIELEKTASRRRVFYTAN